MEIKSFGSICSGVGMQEMAYKRVFNDNIKYFAEIDKFAIKSYGAIHGDIKNLGDFTQAKDIEQVDFMFASTPCQDFSTAGKQKGFEGMRGTLTFEWVEMLRRLKLEGKIPKVIGFENVPGIISKKFVEGFNIFKKELESLGFNLKQGKLNAKNYGVPQNRERVFLVGFLENTNFDFPKGIVLEKKLKDILESEVDKKYYIDKEWEFSNMTKEPNHDINEIGQVKGVKFKATRSITDPEKICRCLDTMTGGQREPKIITKNFNINPTGKGMNVNVNVKDVIGTLTTNKGEGPKVLIAASRGRNPKNPSDRTVGAPTEQRLEVNNKGTSNCITTVQKDNLVIEDYKIRKLMPLECWRLMGINDEDFYKAAYTKEIKFLIGGINKCNVKLKAVKENQGQKNMETYVLNTTKDLTDMEKIEIKQMKKELQEQKEKVQNVNIVIEKLEELELSGCAINIIKWKDFMEMQNISMIEKGQHQTVIIELEEKDRQNTGKYMKITSEEGLNRKKLYIILTLIEQIIKSKTYTFTSQKVNIQGNIAMKEDLEKALKVMKILNLKMEYTTRLNSNSALYKQAGNGIVVDVLEAIFQEIKKCEVIEEKIPYDITKTGEKQYKLFG